MDIRVASYAIITDEKNRLLLPHWYSGEQAQGWTLPGGGIEEGEDPADAVIREVFEETGYHAQVQHILGVDSHVIPAERRLRPEQRTQSLHALRIIYRAEIVGGELTVERDGSTNGVDWFRTDQVEELDRVSLVDVGRRMAGLLLPSS